MNRLLFSLVLLIAVSPLLAADFSELKTADAFWKQIQTMQNALSPQDRTKFRKQLDDLRAALTEFEKRHETDARRWDAKFMRLQIDTVQAQLDNRPLASTAVDTVLQEILKAPVASADTKADASFFAADARLQALDSPTAAALTRIETEIAELRKNYPDDPRTAMIQFALAQFLRTSHPDKAEKILRELTGHRSPQIVAAAQRQLQSIEMFRNLTKEPLALKFKAIDGTEVDLARLRGKVVLVDFWATWCGPCRDEMPNVVAAYNQLHKDGFEIVGISLDSRKEALLSYTQKAGMTWPQYFDGKAWENEISSRFGIDGIPAAWLVDKKGFVRHTEVRGSALGEQVKKLLAE